MKHDQSNIKLYKNDCKKNMNVIESFERNRIKCNEMKYDYIKYHYQMKFDRIKLYRFL